MNRKGMYYIFDALLAGVLLMGVLILIVSMSDDSTYSSPNFLSQDLLNALSTIKVHELPADDLASISNQDDLYLNISVFEQIGRFWALNYSSDASLLADIALSSLNLSKQVTLRVGGEDIYTVGSFVLDDVFISRRMIAGIDKGKPVTGTSASAYLRRIRDKKTSSYAYFGGFTGQGNISKKLILPSDFTLARLISAELKAEIPSDFRVFVNGVLCGGLRSGAEGVVSSHNLSMCSFTNNTNIVLISFAGSIDSAYVSGGYIKATYTTDSLREGESLGVARYDFPGINGLINVYDSISAQGTITGWRLNITFENIYDTFMTIANETVFYAPGQNDSRNIIITNNDPDLPPSQIPIRVGVSNLSNITTVLNGTPADTFLITDVSGSMSTCGLLEEEDVQYCSYEYRSCFLWFCNWYPVECPYSGSCAGNPCGGTTNTRNHNSFNKTEQVCTASFMDVAKDAGKVFVDEVLGESSQHRIGLVSFSTNSNLDHVLSNIGGSLKSTIDGYSADGGTCTCCGLNRARNEIMSSDKERFIILLSDGVPTYYCDNLNDYTGSGTGSTMEQDDVDAALASAQEACDNNITVYSIGFGDLLTVEGHDVLRQLACNESLYYSTTDMDELADIFRNISSQILLQANFSSQTIEVVGDFVESNLSVDSYLEIFFDPFESSVDVGKIELSFESDPFSCDASIYIPSNLEITDAKIASFSGNEWTRKLNIKNDDFDELVYDIDLFGSDYPVLGDPFQIQVPSVLLMPGQINNLSIVVGDSPSNISSCMPFNTLIYTGFINSTTPRTDSLEFADGCLWSVETAEGTFLELDIPEDYSVSGSNRCYYNSSSDFINNKPFNDKDAYDVAMFNLLRQLDPDEAGRIIVDLDESDLEIQLTIVGSIPYMWGPSIAEVEVRP